MNGAQVASLLTIIQSVSEGTLPRASAVQIIVVAFNVSVEKADLIIGEVGRTPSPPLPEVVQEETADA